VTADLPPEELNYIEFKKHMTISIDYPEYDFDEISNIVTLILYKNILYFSGSKYRLKLDGEWTILNYRETNWDKQ